jgi:hypothetical protein
MVEIASPSATPPLFHSRAWHDPTFAKYGFQQMAGEDEERLVY